MPDISSGLSNTKGSESNVKKVVEQSIVSIAIEGNKNVDDASILAASQLTVGDVFNELKLSIAKKKIKNLGAFKSVDSSVEKKANGVAIVLTVQEYQLVTGIEFQGNSIYTEEFLLEQMRTTVGSASNIRNVRKDIQLLESLYDEDGYMEAKVVGVDTPKTANGPVVFHIAEGIIEDISITGNFRTRDYVILREMDIRPGDVLSTKALQSDIRKVFNLNFFENIVPEITPAETPHHYHLNLL